MILRLTDLPIKEKTACTIGNFDGVHKGHKKILDKLKNIASERNLKTVVITFYPHPRKILNPKQYKCSIVNLETKVQLLKEAKIDYILVVDFDKNFYEKQPEDFLNFLKEKINCKYLVVGKDWRFGYKRSGDINLAKSLEEKLDYKVVIIEDITEENKRISSSDIRDFLKNGNLKRAAQLLGRDYYLIDKVVEGDKKGRELGFPTINLKPDDDLCLKKGVYAGFICYENVYQKAVINYGNRPTVDGTKTFMEAHIIEDLKIHPKTNDYVKLIFKTYLREEKKFNSIDELKNQIKLDIQKALEVLNESINL